MLSVSLLLFVFFTFDFWLGPKTEISEQYVLQTFVLVEINQDPPIYLKTVNFDSLSLEPN